MESNANTENHWALPTAASNRCGRPCDHYQCQHFRLQHIPTWKVSSGSEHACANTGVCIILASFFAEIQKFFAHFAHRRRNRWCTRTRSMAARYLLGNWNTPLQSVGVVFIPRYCERPSPPTWIDHHLPSNTPAYIQFFGTFSAVVWSGMKPGYEEDCFERILFKLAGSARVCARKCKWFTKQIAVKWLIILFDRRRLTRVSESSSLSRIAVMCAAAAAAINFVSAFVWQNQNLHMN